MKSRDLNLSGNMATRDIEYQVKNAKGKDVHDVEVVLIEKFVPGKEGNANGICGGNGCSNKATMTITIKADPV
jgi:hypothetical protein